MNCYGFDLGLPVLLILRKLRSLATLPILWTLLVHRWGHSNMQGELILGSRSNLGQRCYKCNRTGKSFPTHWWCHFSWWWDVCDLNTRLGAHETLKCPNWSWKTPMFKIVKRRMKQSYIVSVVFTDIVDVETTWRTIGRSWIYQPIRIWNAKRRGKVSTWSAIFWPTEFSAINKLGKFG